MKRLISHTEISTAFDCQAKHAFSYTGVLTGGDALKSRQPHIRLRAGRAWGRAFAAIHGCDPGVDQLSRLAVGLQALNASLDEDSAQLEGHGFYDLTEHHDLATRLSDVLWHYICTSDPLHLTDPEIELIVPIPSRSGVRKSNRFAFHGFLDGLTVIDARLWIVEAKLRDRLTDYAQIVLGRQYRRYAWATERRFDIQVAGVIVDERLSDAPKPARWVSAKRKGDGVNGRVPSHAKDQLTTPDLYREACAEAGVDPDPETVAALGQRRWQARHMVMFRRSEIEEAGRELVSAAQLIAQLDTGALHPVRNPDPRRCPGCAFKDVCAFPEDRELVDVNFDRVVPKRDRIPLLEGSTP